MREPGGDDEAERAALRPYGYAPWVAAAREAEPAGRLGRVLTVHRIAWDVVTARGVERARAGVRWAVTGLARLERPTVGDWVRLDDGAHGDLAIGAVLPRRSLLVRKAAGRADEPQALAANVDYLAVVTALGADFSARRLERYAVLAREAGVRLAVLCSKSDLCDDATRARLLDEARAATGDATVLCTSVASGEGLDALRALAGSGVTLALVGSSGVGKSSLANALLGADDAASEAQRVGAVREHDQQGRHTTTRRELRCLPAGGVLVDTPGMRELAPWMDEDAAVDDAFDDLAQAAQGCRFRDCSHAAEPGCAVRAAVASGALALERVAAWQALRATQDKQQAARRVQPTAGRPGPKPRRR